MLHDKPRGFSMGLDFDKPAQLWRAPVETVSLSEGGLERMYQQSMLLPRWEIDIPPGQNWAVEIKVNLAPLGVKAEEKLSPQEVEV